jgi:hypothetical protein
MRVKSTGQMWRLDIDRKKDCVSFGKTDSMPIRNVIAHQWVSRRDPRHKYVIHKDYDMSNFKKDNLIWGTRADYNCMIRYAK